MSLSEDAGTFVKARQSIGEQLQRLTFSVVTRDVTIPEDSRETGQNGSIYVKYYHGTSEERNVSMSYRERPKTIWFNKSKRMRAGFTLGPALIAPTSPDGIPAIGDWIVGVAESSPPPRGAHAAAKKHSGMQYISWALNVKPLYELARLFLSTQELAVSESALRQKLRTTTEHGEDELYALTLLVLLGNIEVFDPTKTKALDIRMSYSQFVQDCAIRFNDDSIWKKYVGMYPSVLPPAPVAAPVKPAHPLMIPGFSMEALKSLNAATSSEDVHMAPAPIQYAAQSMDALNASFFTTDFQPPLPPTPPPPPPPPSLESLSAMPAYSMFTPVSPANTPPASPPYKPNFDYNDIEF
jgi:hypothetical protein